jgi:hypothetical protein
VKWGGYSEMKPVLIGLAQYLGSDLPQMVQLDAIGMGDIPPRRSLHRVSGRD